MNLRDRNGCLVDLGFYCAVALGSAIAWGVGKAWGVW